MVFTIVFNTIKPIKKSLKWQGNAKLNSFFIRGITSVSQNSEILIFNYNFKISDRGTTSSNLYTIKGLHDIWVFVNFYGIRTGI